MEITVARPCLEDAGHLYAHMEPHGVSRRVLYDLLPGAILPAMLVA